MFKKKMFYLEVPEGSKFTPFRNGSLIYCLLEAYGINEFRIKNHYGFNLLFDYEEKVNPMIDYDTKFYLMLSQVLTTREQNKFKRLIRYNAGD